MRETLRRLALLAALGAVAAAARAVSAEDAPPAAGEIELRIYDVADLVFARGSFSAPLGPWPVQSDEVNDESHPLFGAESEEATRPLGWISDLVERVRVESGSPVAWERDGTRIDADGTDCLVVRATRDLHRKVQETLDRLRRDVVRGATVDAVLLEGDVDAARGGDGVAEAIASGALHVVGGARAEGLEQGTALLFVGRQRAYLQDHDVEVAEDSRTTDPIVSVRPEGLCVAAQVEALSPSVVLWLDAWWARDGGTTEAATVDGDRFELPATEGAAIRYAPVTLRPGAWTALTLDARRLLAIRAAVFDGPPARPEAPLPTLAPVAALGPVIGEAFPIGDFLTQWPSSRAPDVHLYPSNFTPPEPPELSEPRKVLPEDMVTEIAKGTVDPDSWTDDRVSLGVRDRRLEVRHDARHLEGVRTLLTALRQRFLGTLRLRGTVVRLPLASFPEWLAGADPSGLLADGARALLARPGAEVLATAGLRMARRGGRAGTAPGRMHTYVGDYDVEIAKDVAIGNPVERRVLEGLALDVEAAPAAGGAAVIATPRITRSTWEGSRSLPTRHGAIDLPTLGLLQLRGGTVIPVGQTRLVGLGVEGDTATLVLLTANIAPD